MGFGRKIPNRRLVEQAVSVLGFPPIGARLKLPLLEIVKTRTRKGFRRRRRNSRSRTVKACIQCFDQQRFRRRRKRQRCLLWKDRQTEAEKPPKLQVRRSRRRRGSSPISDDLGLGQVGDLLRVREITVGVAIGATPRKNLKKQAQKKDSRQGRVVTSGSIQNGGEEDLRLLV
ncbi:hypothetical protein U1Q18_028326 [Sarracenia purpurea var. burkii]